MFYRVIENTAHLFEDDGSVVTRMPDDMPRVWPIGSDLSGRYEHPHGIALTLGDAEHLNIPRED